MTAQDNALDLFAELNTINTEELTDFNNTQTGGGRGLLPAGTAFVRPVYYVESGIQKQREFQGVTKDPAPMFEIGFAIVGGSGVNAEGKPEKYVLEEGKFPIIKSFDQPISLFEKSKCVGIHKALNRVGNKCNHPVQKLAESPLYQLSITHRVPEKGKNAGKTVADYDFRTLQPAWDSINACEVSMPAVPPSMIQAFLWDKPSLGQWDSIFIDGQFDAEKDESGKITKPARSKNFIQEKIMNALNWEGSKIQKLLQSANRDVVLPAPSLEADASAAPTVAAPPADVAVPAGTVPSVPDLD